jgi:hypothetical protein
MIQATDVDGLISPPPTLLEAFKVFCWSVSAVNDAKFAEAKMEFGGEAPFCQFD